MRSATASYCLRLDAIDAAERERLRETHHDLDAERSLAFTRNREATPIMQRALGQLERSYFAGLSGGSESRVGENSDALGLRSSTRSPPAIRFKLTSRTRAAWWSGVRLTLKPRGSGSPVIRRAVARPLIAGALDGQDLSDARPARDVGPSPSWGIPTSLPSGKLRRVPPQAMRQRDVAAARVPQLRVAAPRSYRIDGLTWGRNEGIGLRVPLTRREPPLPRASAETAAAPLPRSLRSLFVHVVHNRLGIDQRMVELARPEGRGRRVIGAPPVVCHCEREQGAQPRTQRGSGPRGPSAVLVGLVACEG